MVYRDKDKEGNLFCGDSEVILSEFPDNCIDLTITSPPYDDLRDYEGYSFNFEGIANQLFRVTKDGGVVVWIVGDKTVNGSETGKSADQAKYFRTIGFKQHDTMIYKKRAFANPSRNRYHQVFEYMYIFVKGKLKTFNPIMDKPNKTEYDFGKSRRNKDGSMNNKDDKSRIKLKEYGMRFNVWEYSTGKGNSTKDNIAYKHPAVFPEKLAEDHIISWSNPGDIVLDPMCGSGTTCKMAKLNGRQFIGIDISEYYLKEICVPRLKSIEGEPVC